MRYDDWKADAPDPGTVEDLDPSVYCLKHGKPLFSEDGSYCEDCEPPEDDGERMTRAERDAVERDEQIHIYTHLK